MSLLRKAPTMANSLQDLLNEQSAVELLRNTQTGSYIYPVVPADFTNWIKEQRAWRDTAALYDQTHHMDQVSVSGPDVMTRTSDTAISSVETLQVRMTSQYVPASSVGAVSGDGTLSRGAEEQFTSVRRAPVTSWLTDQAETGDYKSLDLRV